MVGWLTLTLPQPRAFSSSSSDYSVDDDTSFPCSDSESETPRDDEGGVVEGDGSEVQISEPQSAFSTVRPAWTPPPSPSLPARVLREGVLEETTAIAFGEEPPALDGRR